MDLEPAKVFEDRQWPGDWRVERIDDDGGIEVVIFSGPNARERALRYADRQYGDFEEIMDYGQPNAEGRHFFILRPTRFRSVR